MKTLTSLEILIGLTFITLAVGEIVTLVRARRSGRTRNRSRLYTHGAMSAIVVAVLAYGQYWLALTSSGDFYGEVGAKPVLNWPMMALGVVAVLLALYEVIGVFEASRTGKTSNLSRLFSHVAMLLLLVALVSISVQKWDIYLQGFRSTYESSIPGAARGR
jgi:cytochrome bd-type quinol oxidase subunit 2